MSGRTLFAREEEAMAEAMGRELEALASHSNLGPTDDFTDRVMISIAAEPAPQPVVD